VREADDSAARAGGPLSASLTLAWTALLLLLAWFDGGGSTSRGLAVAAGVPLLGLAAYAVLVAAGRVRAPVVPALGVAALCLLAAWAALALASMAWSIAPARSWTDATRTIIALAGFAAGLCLASLLPRPARAVCSVVCAVAVGIAAWALVDRSFSSLASHFQLTPRLEQPFPYPNALGITLAAGCLAALSVALSGRGPRAPVGAGALALLLYTLPATGSRGSVLALVVGLVVLVAVCRRPLEALVVLASAAVFAVPAGLWAASLGTFSRFPAATPQFTGAAGARLVLTGASVALGGAALATLLLSLTDLAGPERRRGALRIALGAGAAAVLLGLAAFAVKHGGPVGAVQSVWHGLAGGGQVGNASGSRLTNLGSNLRSTWWSEAWHAFRLRPWYGFGAGTFTLVDTLLRHNAVIAGEAHNAGLHVLSGLGLPGGLLALGALAAIAVGSIRGLRRLTGREREAGVAVVAILVALAVHAQLDWDWDFAVITLIAYPSAGIMVAAGAERRTADAPARTMGAVLVPVALLAALVALLPYLSSLAETRASNLADAGRNDAALVENDLARTLEPVSTDVLLQRVGILQALGRIGESQDAMREALRLSPLDSVIWERAGIFQRDCWGDPGAARLSFMRAIQLSGHRLTTATLPPRGPCAGSTSPG
jgi:hypothetical protein